MACPAGNRVPPPAPRPSRTEAGRVFASLAHNVLIRLARAVAQAAAGARARPQHGLPDYEISFTHAAAFSEPLVVGDAVRWVGPGAWRVEEVRSQRVTVRLWPDDEPYPVQIKEYGSEWLDEEKRP